MASELVTLDDDSGDPRFAVCYARGSVFRREGRFLRVERGKRTVVNRALCMAQAYEKRCLVCPNFSATLTLKPLGEK